MMPQQKNLPKINQKKFFHQFERLWEERMRLRRPMRRPENAELKRSQTIPDPEFGQTLASRRTPRSQGELRRQDQGPRDEQMTRLTTEAEETTAMTVA